MKIGIGITTYNRREVFEKTLFEIKKFAPKNSKIVIIDDGSDVALEVADFRFEVNQGSPVAKNKCFELLEDCDHIFLFDDDIYPVKNNWYKPYIKSKESHLNYTFKYNFDVWEKHKIHDNPNGCMMYFDRKVLDTVGGFDTNFYKYGYWHGNMSCRIYNVGLTSFPFMDVVGSDKLFYSLDEHKEVISATKKQFDFIPKNKKRYFDTLGSSAYFPYKSNPKIWYSNPYSTEKNIGKALNEFCELVPDNDWICLQDGDMMYLTPDWGLQIEKAVEKYGNHFSLIGCLTNKLGRDIQRYKGEFCNNENINYHFEIAEKLRKEHFAEIEDITHKKQIAGLFMLFPKSLWNEIKFKENIPDFDDEFSKEVINKGGKLGLMKGLYVYHLYRIWSDKPIGDKKHLI